MKLHIIVLMILNTSAVYAKTINAFSDLSFAKQTKLLRACVLIVEQSNYYLKDNGVKNVKFKSRDDLSRYCEKGFNQFVDWNQVKSESSLDDVKTGCNIAKISGEVLLGEKYDKNDYIKQVCALPMLVCVSDEMKVKKSGEEIRKCVIKNRG